MKKILSLVLCTALILTACQSNTSSEPDEESSLDKKVYIAVENDNQVAVVDPETTAVIKRIDLSGMPHNVQVSPNGETVWVTVNAMGHDDDSMMHSENSMMDEGDQLVVIDTEKDEIIQKIKLGTELHLAHVVLSSDSLWTYATAQEADEIFVVDAQTYALEKTIQLAENAQPHGLRLSPDGEYAYVALMGSKGMEILNLKTEESEIIDFNDAVVQTGLTLDGKYAFASLYSTKELGVYNIETKEVSAIALPDAKGPVQVYATPDSRYVYIADQGYYFDQPTSNKVYKVDLLSQEVVGTITAGEGPHGVAISKDGLEIYVTNLVSGDLSIIDTKIDEVIKKIEVGEAPNGVSVWESKTQESSITLTPVDSISHSHGLAVDIEEPSKLYIATHEGLFLLKDDKDLYRIGEAENDLMGFTTDKKNSNTFYASGHPSHGGNSGFQKTSDGGETWQKVSDGLDGPVDFHAMTVSSVNSNLIYGLFHGVIQKSSDGGENWSALQKIPTAVISLLADNTDENTLYTTTQKGLWISSDGGETWESLSTALVSSIIVTLAQDPMQPKNMLSVSDTFGLAKSEDGGKTWASIENIPKTFFYFISFSQTVPGLVYSIDQENRIYKSIDSGNTWEKIY